MLTSERVAAVLGGLEQNALACEAEEMDEILALGLAVEADPDDMAILRWLQPVVREFTRVDLGSPGVVAALEEWLAKTNKDLSSDWYRMTTGRAERERREGDKVSLQRALGLVRDAPLMQSLGKIAADSQRVAPGAGWVTCPPLGVELYAITTRGRSVLRSLAVRLERFAQAPIKSFLHAFDKTQAKMRTFGGQVTTLAQNIGYVKKNREQVIIGLVKTGAPVGHALGAYHTAMRATDAPEVAVTCARNAATFGSPAHAAQRLELAKLALRQAGYPDTPIAMGVAKALLPYNPPAAGIPRFTELMRHLAQSFGHVEFVYKLAARVMPAAGEPPEVARRVFVALDLLQRIPGPASNTVTAQQMAAAALGAMARSQEALPELVKRLREIERRLVANQIAGTEHALADALECVACPGTPSEVVDTMVVLLDQLAQGRTPERGDVAIAAAFAKRFAY